MTQFSRGPAWIKPAALVALLALLGLLLGPRLSGWLAGAPAEKPAASQPTGSFKASDSQWATLSFAKVETRLFRTLVETDGKIAVNDDHTTQIYSPVSGRVTQVIAHAGDMVRQGDPLLRVDASEFVQGQNDLVAAKSALAAASAQLQLAEAAAQRQRDLFAAKGTAQKDLQQAEADLAAARAGHDSAAIGLATARNRLAILGRSASEIAALEAAPDRLAMGSEIVVPAVIGGTVMSRQVGPGEYINSAANSGSQIFTIADLSVLWLVANLREADSGLVRVGDEIEASVPAYPGRIFRGRLTYVAAAIDPNTRRLAVRAEIANEDHALKPEMFASFRVISAVGASRSAAVPDSAVIYEGDKARLWIAQPADKTLSLRSIKVGRIEDGMVEVTDALQPGEIVVTKGALFIDRAAKSD